MTASSGGLRSRTLSRTAVLLIALVTRAAAAADPKELFAAVAADDATRLEKALERNPDGLNTKGPGGQTPLMHAVLTGKLSAVKVLLGHGADTTIGEKDGYTPMHGAGFQVCPRLRADSAPPSRNRISRAEQGSDGTVHPQLAYAISR